MKSDFHCSAEKFPLDFIVSTLMMSHDENIYPPTRFKQSQ